MTFKLSKRSLQRLEGVKPDLVRVVKRAIELTKVDFGVVQGLRTPEEQAANVAKGASQTLNSKHLTGDAVDLVAYIGPNISWDEKYYPTIADGLVRPIIHQPLSMSRAETFCYKRAHILCARSYG